jgi:hypothetical protein
MATNVQNTRTTTHPDGHTVVETTPTSAINSTGIGGVAVYDHDGDRVADTTGRPASIHSDPIPAATGSGGSVISWIIGAIVLIVLAYFLFQILF